MNYEEEIRAGRYTDHETMSNKVHEWIKTQYYNSKADNAWEKYAEIDDKIDALFTDIYKEIDGLYPADGYPAWNEARDQMLFIKNEQHKQDINWGTANA